MVDFGVAKCNTSKIFYCKKEYILYIMCIWLARLIIVAYNVFREYHLEKIFISKVD